MKTNLRNRIVLFSVMGGVLTLSSCSENDTHTCPETKENVESIITGKVNIPISALAGEKMITISPSGKWTLSIPDEVTWLKVEPMSGDINNTTLKFTANENVDFIGRDAQLTFTTGTTTQTMTVTQEATAKSIVIYVDNISVSTDKKVMVLERIITNLADIEISEYPEWISSVTLTKVVDGAYSATLELEDGNYDTADRVGNIVLKEKGTDFSVSYDMTSLKTKHNYVISGPAEIGGYGKDGYVAFNVQVAVSPNAEEFELKCYEYVPDWDAYMGSAMSNIIIEPVASTNAAFTSKQYIVKVPNYIYESDNDWDMIGEQPRVIGVFAVPTSNNNFNPNTVTGGVLRFTQNQQDKNKLFELVGEENSRPMYSFDKTQPVRHEIIVKSLCYLGYAFGEPNSDELSETNCGITNNSLYAVAMKSQSAPDSKGYITYTFEVTMPAVPEGEGQRNAFLAFVEADAEGKFIVEDSGYDVSVNMLKRITYIQR
ncbi:MAG: BACON domain-containing protein [Marinifilaceae bacterium]